MIVCDRCGSKILTTTAETKQSLIIYQRQAAYIGHNVDLCEDCRRELENVIQKAQSYFMVNKEKPSAIFDTVKYWSD